MNYEQKYKEALERAMKLALTGNVSALAAGEIFPELKESEDEKIRKEIIDFITSSNKYGTNERCEAWLDWLEKQGNRKMVDADKVIEWIHNYWPLSWGNFTLKVDDAIEKFKQDFGL